MNQFKYIVVFLDFVNNLQYIDFHIVYWHISTVVCTVHEKKYLVFDTQTLFYLRRFRIWKTSHLNLI